ncbi:MAG: MFS transporter [Anaeromyxobacter sp.]|nr:MFS transporter [Anaeromyxobacter sp.]
MATDPAPAATHRSGLLNAAVIVAALGYFVDIYDLVLFSMLWKPSLAELGFDAEQASVWYDRILTIQNAGMLLGGIGFGVLGDKKGRLHILFGSITLYSLATLANGFVTDVWSYTACRFLAGVGLAGELGAGVTLVAEILPARLRGYGTMIIASVGVSGAVVANLLAGHFGWRIAYVSGGGLGLLLLLLRVGVVESGLFAGLGKRGVARGDFFAIFTTRDRFGRFARSVLIGLPIWFSQAVLVSKSPDLAVVLGVTGEVLARSAVAAFYTGLVFGDLASGAISQALRSRRAVVLLFQSALGAATVAYFVVGRGATPSTFYVLCGVLGLAAGYWAILVTVGAEQFGTNLRATVATSVPNFVRGLAGPMAFAYAAASQALGSRALGAPVVGAAVLVIALWAASGLRETFGKDLDYLEE